MLVITGGAHVEPASFLEVFDADPGVQWMHARQPRAQQFFNARIADVWDAYVLYDLPGITFAPGGGMSAEAPPEELVVGFEELCEGGHGFVVVHHALGGWPRWPAYGEALAGRFLHEPGRFGGQVYPSSGYRPETWHRVSVAQPDHPVTAGLGAGFDLVDDLFLMPIDPQRSTPLLRSDFEFAESHFSSAELRASGRPGRREGWRHPPGSNVVAWTTRCRNSDIVCIQPGGRAEAHRHPAFRRLVGNALRWVARERPGGPALPYPVSR